MELADPIRSPSLPIFVHRILTRFGLGVRSSPGPGAPPHTQCHATNAVTVRPCGDAVAMAPSAVPRLLFAHERCPCSPCASSYGSGMIAPLLDCTSEEKKAHGDLPNVPEMAYVRCQCLR